MNTMSMNPIDVMRIQDMITNAIKPLRNRIEDLEKENKKLSSELTAIRSQSICCCPSMFKCRIHSVDMFRVDRNRTELSDMEVDETRRTRMVERIRPLEPEKKKTQMIDGNELADILKQSAPVVTRNVLNFSNISSVNGVDNDDLNMDVEDVKLDFEYPDEPQYEPLPLFPLFEDWLAERRGGESDDPSLSLPKLSVADIRRATREAQVTKMKTIEEEFNDFFGPIEDDKPEDLVEEKKEELINPVVQKKKRARKTEPVKRSSQDPNDLDSMKIDDLKAYCRANNIKGFSKYKKKNDLINFIRSNQ